jgi:hypothetical protein
MRMETRIGRQEFVVTLVSETSAWPLAARAATTPKRFRLTPPPPRNDPLPPKMAALVLILGVGYGSKYPRLSYLCYLSAG